MKKILFLMAMTAMTLGGFTACGGDDDDDNGGNNNTESTLKTPSYADQASRFETNVKGDRNGTEFDLATFNATEDGCVLVELVEPQSGKKHFVTDRVSNASNGKYTMSGSKINGTMEILEDKARTRATNSVRLKVNVTVKIPGIGDVNFAAEAAQAIRTIAEITTNSKLINLARTWNITGYIIDVTGDGISVTGSKEFSGGDLRQVRDEAVKRGVNLTDSEKEEFNRIVKSVTLTREGTFIIEYQDDRQPDVATWSWLSSQYNSFRLKMKDSAMGNRFINDDSSIDLQFRDTRCNLIFNTTIKDGNKKQDVTLTIQLKDA